MKQNSDQKVSQKVNELCECSHGLTRHNRYLGDGVPFGCSDCSCSEFVMKQNSDGDSTKIEGVVKECFKCGDVAIGKTKSEQGEHAFCKGCAPSFLLRMKPGTSGRAGLCGNIETTRFEAV